MVQTFRKRIAMAWICEVLECQCHMPYLRRTLRLMAMHDEGHKNRTAKASAKVAMCKGERIDKDIAIKYRLKLFDAVETPTMLYGSGCLVMTTERQRELRSTQRRMMRKVLGSGRKYKLCGDDSELKTIEHCVDWIQRTTRKAEGMMNKYWLLDCVRQKRTRMCRWAGQAACLTDGRWNHETLSLNQKDADHEEGREPGRPINLALSSRAKLASTSMRTTGSQSLRTKYSVRKGKLTSRHLTPSLHKGM